MSGLLKSNLQLGDSATATQNFVLTVPAAPDGTLKLARGNAGATTQDILTVDASGNVVDVVNPKAALAGSATQDFATANLTASSLNGGAFAFRNKIINGGFDIWQRGTSANLTTSYVYQSADRWFTGINTAALGTVAQINVGNGVGTRYSLRLQRTAGQTLASTMHAFYVMETADCVYKLAGIPMTLSFWARAGSGASFSTLNATLVSGQGTDQTANQLYTSVWTNATTVATTAAALTTSWARFAITGTTHSSTSQLGINLNVATTGTAGANDYVEITGAQLEVGSVATPFEVRPYGTELALCQQYYYRVFPNSTSSILGTASVQSTISGYGYFPFPVTMRVAPSAVDTTATASDYLLNVAAGAVANTTVPTINARTSRNLGVVDLTFTGGSTAGQAGYLGTSAGSAAGYVGWTAEL